MTSYVNLRSPNTLVEDASCNTCWIQADPSGALHGTWTSATYHPEMAIELPFKGKY